MKIEKKSRPCELMQGLDVGTLVVAVSVLAGMNMWDTGQIKTFLYRCLMNYYNSTRFKENHKSFDELFADVLKMYNQYLPQANATIKPAFNPNLN